MFNQQFFPQQQFNPYQYQQVQPQPQGSAFQEVEGPESIQMIRMYPNSKSVFFDKHLDRFYAVSTDAAGTKAIEAYDFVPAEKPKEPEYVTREEFDAWRSSYEQPVPRQHFNEPARNDVRSIRSQYAEPSAGPAADGRDA